MTPHLHRSTWMVCVATAVVCALVVVPGENQVSYLAAHPTYSHGWPLEFLSRHVDNTPVSRGSGGKFYLLSANWISMPPPSTAPWTSWDSWRFWHVDDSEWNPSYLLVDGFIAMVIVASVTALWERRRRRRANAFQFRLAEMLALTCLVAILLGWLQNKNRVSAREQQLCNQIADAGLYPDRECCAPAWLRRLVGTGYLPSGFFHIVEIDLSPEDLVDHQELAHLLVQLKYLHTVRLHMADRNIRNAFDVLAKLKSLRTVDFSTYGFSVNLTEQEVAGLVRLTQLTELRLGWKRQFDQELLATIRQLLPRCRITFEHD